MSVVISVRVKKELKEEAEKLGINFKKLFENALVRAIEEEKRRRFERAVKTFLSHLGDLSDEEWVKLVRESRDSR
ncbi:MAG: type II toxin-antitoxin system CcdA family antitoxin [Candidatus Njordarchaeia archaeon]